MLEPPEIVVLRARLPAVLPPGATAHQSHSIAVSAFDVILKAVERGVLPFGHWERSGIYNGLLHIRQGYYQKALTEARFTVKPLSERQVEVLVPRVRSLSITKLRADLESLRVQWARES